MKYKNETKDTLSFKQNFSEFVDNYQLLLREDKLYKSDTPVNRQELIESSRETALSNALEKFLPKDTLEDEESIIEYTRQQTDLDVLMEAENVANEYRKRFNLPDSLTTREVYDVVNRQSILLKEQLDNISKTKEVKPNGTSQENKE